METRNLKAEIIPETQNHTRNQVQESIGVSNKTVNVAAHNLAPGAVSGIPVTLCPLNVTGVNLTVTGALDAVYLGGYRALISHTVFIR